MKLQLTRPLIFFDLETTGTNINTDRIVQIAIIKLMPNGEEYSRERLINPEMPIPAESTAIHHITDQMVADKPTFKQIARSLADIFAGCDIAGFNSNRFDIPLLDQEFCRAGVDFDFSKARFIDVQTIYHKKEPRTLRAAHMFYCGKDFDDAHDAFADTTATKNVLLAQLEHYDDLPTEVGALSEFASNSRNVDFMGRLVYDDQNREVINFGKYKGQLAEDVLRRDQGYYSWIIGGDFAQNTKKCFTRVYMRVKQSKK